MKEKIYIAVCDDSIFDRDITKIFIDDYLEAKGYDAEIDTFSSGTDFLKSDLSKYSLVFLDIYMAGINGVDTARSIVKQKKDIKIIFCSSSPEFVKESFEVDAIRYFIKPIKRQKFQEVMDEFFTNRSEQTKPE